MIKGYHTFILRRIPSKQLIVLLDNSYSQEIQDIKNRIWSALIKEPIKDVKPKLSNLLFDACANNESWIQVVSASLYDSPKNT